MTLLCALRTVCVGVTACVLVAGAPEWRIRAHAAQADRRLSVGQAPERRLALVVGNDTYGGAPLKNARSDARAIARALEEVGFIVTRVEDATRGSLNDALETFGNGLQASDVALFYFAGHGAQVEGENYLIPIDFRGESAMGVRLNGLPVSTVQQALGRARVSLLVLDACRNNPFTGQRSGGAGLAPMEARGNLIAFATGAGQTASDNGAAANGLFTQELLKVLREPGLPVSDAFKRVRQPVYQATNGRQFPAVYDGLVGEFAFRPATRPASTPVANPSDGANAGAAADLARREELAFWEAIKDSRESAPFEEYLRQYPEGRFKVAAEARLAELRRASTPTPSPATGGRGGRGNSTAPVRSDPTVQGLQWARIPAGTFQMGCVPGDSECEDDEKPRHSVTLTRAFDLMTREATVGMFRAYGVRRALPVQPDWNTNDAQPVVNVTWDEATAFCGSAGGRLPTEAEWEYAARGAADGWKYVWGNTEKPEVNGRSAANVADESMKRKHSDWTIFSGYDDGYPEAAPVGSFPANGFGLSDMAGNVWEWSADWYGAYPGGAATDPRGPSSGQRRVVRGGSWNLFPKYSRVSYRYIVSSGDRNNLIGFRCARDVFP